MTELPAHEVTRLLQAWSEGDEGALQKLMPLVYTELHRLARRYMAGERPGHTLQTSALVHEAYLRLVDVQEGELAKSRPFLRRLGPADAAHPGGLRALPRLSQARWRCPDGLVGGGVNCLSGARGGRGALDDALKTLAEIDPRRSRVVELRFFGGLSAEESAEVLKVSAETVMHDWKLAKVWLLRELSVDKGHES